MSENQKLDINIKADATKTRSSGFLRFILWVLIFGVIYTFYNHYNLKMSPEKTGLVIEDRSLEYITYQKTYNKFKGKKCLTETKESFLETCSKIYDFVDLNGNDVFIINFNGDMFASQVYNLRKEVDAIISFAKEGDEVLINIMSPGGTVTGYGLVASQLERLKKNKIKVTASVDQVAASGGYMAAVVADEIIAAPFAVVGSIGVVANVPVVEELLNKIGIDYKTYTAGDSKRTVTTYKKPTPEQEDKFEKKLESIHNQFKEHVASYRSQVNIEKATNGDFFSGAEAMELGLVDRLLTSDEFVRNKYLEGYQLLEIYYKEPKSSTESFISATVSSFVKSIKTEILKESQIPLI
jgi:serine protease SohB